MNISILTCKEFLVMVVIIETCEILAIANQSHFPGQHNNMTGITYMN